MTPPASSDLFRPVFLGAANRQGGSAWRVDEVRKRRRYCQQKPCGFAAALGRRQRVAHNSTGPTSV